MLRNLGAGAFSVRSGSLGKMSLFLQHFQYLLSEFFRQMRWRIRLDCLLSMIQNHTLALIVTKDAELLGLLFLSMWHSWAIRLRLASAEASWCLLWQPACWAILPFLVHTRFSEKHHVTLKSSQSLLPFTILIILGDIYWEFMMCQAMSYIFYLNTLGRYCCVSHFSDEEAEALKDRLTYPQPHS